MDEPEDRKQAEPEIAKARLNARESDIEESLERTMKLMRPLAAAGAAPEAMLITMTVAALLPVTQATMSFVMASSDIYRQSHTEHAALNANAVPLLAESARRILAPAPAPAPRETTSVARTVSREAEYRSSNELAVT